MLDEKGINYTLKHAEWSYPLRALPQSLEFLVFELKYRNDLFIFLNYDKKIADKKKFIFVEIRTREVLFEFSLGLINNSG